MAENIFEKVLENVDIVDVVKSYVDLEPKGKNLFGLCPFHDDKNPSMSVSREKGIFYCFTCKKGGNAIKFIELYKHLSSIEAAKFLAEQYHIDVSEFSHENQYVTERKRYFDCMGMADKFYQFLMSDETFSKEAREYLLSRKLGPDAIKLFNIGLAPTDPKGLSKTLLDKGFLASDLSLCGLANDQNDVFIDRIMVPIHDEQGRTIAFGGRIYKKGSDQAKYVNSKETPIFKKGEIIFNLDKAAASLREKNYLIINEGYMDVITAYAMGIKNSVALMGTSITAEQIELLKKYTKNIIICLDGDKPGMEGAKVVMAKLEEAGLNFASVLLPDDMDPDDYIRKYGSEKYLDLIENHRLDKLGFAYELTKKRYGAITTFNIESFKNEIFGVIKEEKSETIIESELRRLSIDLDVSYEAVRSDFLSYRQKFDPNYGKEKAFKPVLYPIEGAYRKAEKFIIEYALTGKNYFEEIVARMGGRVFLRDKDLRLIFIAIGDIYDSTDDVSTDDLINKLKDKGLYGDFIYDKNVAYSLQDLYSNVIRTFEKEDLKEEIQDIKGRIKETDPLSDTFKELMERLSDKQKELKK